jgi:hypothetical protein
MSRIDLPALLAGVGCYLAVGAEVARQAIRNRRRR